MRFARAGASVTAVDLSAKSLELAARRAKMLGLEDRIQFYHANAELRQVLDMIGGGYFSADAHDRFTPIVDAVTTHRDHFMLLADYESYIACQDRVDALYRTPDDWAKRAILNIAAMGGFSSDRAVMEYAERIWHVKTAELHPHALSVQNAV